MVSVAPVPQPGRVVRVRQRQYLVEYLIAPPNPGDATLVRLSCLDDDAQGQALEVLWEKEPDAEILTGEDWQRLAERGFDPPHLFAAYLHTLRWNCVTSTNPGLFQAPFRAGIRIDAYQLEPLRKALLLPRVNLFIADDVGLGKTIEAGLIARELLLRKKVRDIVVACPPSMLLQWKEELETRFGLPFEILDKAYVAQVRQERGYGVNPWTTHTRFLISQRLLIDPAYTGPMIDWLGELRAGALLVLDEAHHAAPSSGSKYAIDSKITRAIRELAPRFEHRLFLSATPHNGHSNSFSALLEILDPQRFCRGVPVKGKKLLEDVMVRRLKEDIREMFGGFPKRNVVPVKIDGLPAEAPELALAEMLDQYRDLREQRLAALPCKHQNAGKLLISGLQQRLLSSIEAFARTLRVHRRSVMTQWEKFQAGRQDELPLQGQTDLLAGGVGSDDDRATLSEEEIEAETDAQVEAASAATFGPVGETAAQALFRQEQALLERMTAVADQARSLPDGRVRKLVDWMREHLCPGIGLPGAKPAAASPARWTDTRVIIFTEFDDTKRYLREQLDSAIAGTDRAGERIRVYHGPTPSDEREEIKRAFNTDPRHHPLRILLATDAAREGLNLQCYCHHLFHFDVPWNPSRMEQRNGRIDRKLQPAPEVFCHYFVYVQRPEDRILKKLVEKTQTIKKELGSLAEVVDVRLADSMKNGIRRKSIADQEQEIDRADLDAERKQTVQEELEETRERQEELRAQMDRVRNRLADSQKAIGMKEEHFRSALSCSLELIGADPLQPVAPTAPAEGPERFAFPAIDQRSGADPTWVETMDTLRPPRRRAQKPWEWRRDSPIRPIVFADPGVMSEEVVHLHLEHRIVQRLLGRFRAQGFIHHDLARACLSQSADPSPRVILLGRLCLFGPNAARLHEELVPVAAKWVDPADRKGGLTPFKREGETTTLEILEEAFLKKGQRPLDPVVVNRLQQSAPQDIQALLVHLDERGRHMAEEAAKLLAERGRREADAMRKILVDQKKRIAATADKFREFQPDLLNLDEVKQVESNRRHWAKRLGTIDFELHTEPDRIAALYEVRATRLEPVGLAYLWPVTG